MINPSIYSNHGVYERDFFKSRNENEIRQIFDSIGFAMTDNTFQEVWQVARDRSKYGEVRLPEVLFQESVMIFDMQISVIAITVLKAGLCKIMS